MLDEFDNSPGNLVKLWKHFTNPTEPPLGFSEAVETVVKHLDPSWFLHMEHGLRWGTGFLVVWAASAALAWRVKAHDWLRLHLVVAVALVLAIYSVSRIFGPNWYYLSLWAWGLMAVASVAIIGTAWAALERRASGRHIDVALRVVPAVLALILGVTLVSATVDAVDVTPPEEPVWTELSLLAGPTKAALEAGRGAATGPDGRYVVTWEDPLLFGSQGFGLLTELERAGFDVGVFRLDSLGAGRHRLMDARNATAIVHLATGGAVVYSRTRPGNVEVASVDSRTEEERAEFDALRAETIAALDVAGLRDLALLIDTNLFAAGLDQRMPGPLHPKVARMLELGQELAVFILPPDAFG